ncbi:uncharacterized protein B0I36DRAFT_350970 [Microdochium trichocladiopsis]|uniref:Uncharacterized protein n=1 Tax=Microdochium trichocladiopsis TaxID=1682393 RepID=A0A9P9BN76_9PEZI|nr:uncharacterized protein B0I36DRAFT_350970 [Microdochium trichocladiopsis]KAH7027443.1 hypothetical protein B0I36DRAFT_350970 [Microdochium trichocladiopsis]
MSRRLETAYACLQRCAGSRVKQATIPVGRLLGEPETLHGIIYEFVDIGCSVTSMPSASLGVHKLVRLRPAYKQQVARAHRHGRHVVRKSSGTMEIPILPRHGAHAAARPASGALRKTTGQQRDRTCGHGTVLESAALHAASPGSMQNAANFLWICNGRVLPQSLESDRLR